MGCCNSTRIVREGEKVFMWDKYGRGRVVSGPGRLAIGREERVQDMRLVTCSESQYLTITHPDGHKERVRGPAAVWQHPLEHLSVTVDNAVQVDASELMVVFSHVNAETENVTPKIIRGPALHMPDLDEIVHTFKWHGSDPDHPEKKRPGQLTFQKLRHIPDQVYFTIPEVRTSDDAVLELKFMVFFELVSIEKMMDKTHDPIADFMNTLTADVIAFTASLTYETFMEKTDMLNNLECYHQLTSRANLIGFRITKVAYRGYHCGNLQQMHDDALQARTQLRLEAETEAQSQQQADMKLTKENERQRKKQEMQKSDYEHNNLLSRMQHEEKLAQQNREKEMLLAGIRAENLEKVAFLEKLKTLGVDLTTYLVNQNPLAGANRIHVTSDGTGSAVHIHADKKNL
ncbi:hypothetical protein Pelo_10232 [Pelomyxa schiedti]|nr:hypothetical protein Pelo_10232 [Pelomyxa schiedti]